jgi:hypothetical protein
MSFGSPKVYELKNVTIRVVGSPDDYRDEAMRKAAPLGYCGQFARTIEILGRRNQNGRIIIPWEVLGHEIIHILEAYNIDVEDPDNVWISYPNDIGTCWR